MRDRKDFILDLWSEGVHYSASEIGVKLNVSKNVVIGVVSRARRSGDPRAAFRPGYGPREERKQREVDIVSLSGVKGQRTAVLHPSVESLGRLFEPRLENADGPKTLMNTSLLECHYPLESFTPEGHRIYCGKDVGDLFSKKQRSYCAEHHSRMYYTYKPYRVRARYRGA